MMTTPVHSFLIDRDSAEQVFQQVSVRDMVMAVLATVPPMPVWNGCLVYEGPAPDGEPGTACIGLAGGASDDVQEVLVSAFERLGVKIPKIYEGGPEVRQSIARVRDGVWADR
jgi:hypothetical protein